MMENSAKITIDLADIALYKSKISSQEIHVIYLQMLNIAHPNNPWSRLAVEFFSEEEYTHCAYVWPTQWQTYKGRKDGYVIKTTSPERLSIYLMELVDGIFKYEHNKINLIEDGEPSAI